MMQQNLIVNISLFGDDESWNKLADCVVGAGSLASFKTDQISFAICKDEQLTAILLNYSSLIL